MFNEQSQYFFWDLLQYTINGLSQGSLYALIALGYTMVYGIIRLVNFAHGEFLMVGAMAGFYFTSWGLSPLQALPLSMIVSGVVALIVERAVYRPIRHQGRIPALITAIGTSLLFQYAGQIMFGADPKTMAPIIEEKTFDFGEVYFSNIQLLIFLVTIFVMIFLWWLTHFTKIGKAMRAVSFNLNAAELMGIDTNKVIAFTFFLGSSLAALAGMLVSYTMSIEPMMGTMPGIKAFVAAVVGGIGVIPGAAIGGFILGITENMVVGFYKASYRDAVAFIILIIILLFKPSGILGKNVKEKV